MCAIELFYILYHCWSETTNGYYVQLRPYCPGQRIHNKLDRCHFFSSFRFVGESEKKSAKNVRKRTFLHSLSQLVWNNKRLNVQLTPYCPGQRVHNKLDRCHFFSSFRFLVESAKRKSAKNVRNRTFLHSLSLLAWKTTNGYYVQLRPYCPGQRIHNKLDRCHYSPLFYRFLVESAKIKSARLVSKICAQQNLFTFFITVGLKQQPVYQVIMYGTTTCT